MHTCFYFLLIFSCSLGTANFRTAKEQRNLVDRLKRKSLSKYKKNEPSDRVTEKKTVLNLYQMGKGCRKTIFRSTYANKTDNNKNKEEKNAPTERE